MRVSQWCPKPVNEKRIFNLGGELSSCNVVPRTGIEPVRQLSQPRILSPLSFFKNTFFISPISKSYQQFKPAFHVSFHELKTVNFRGTTVPYVSPV